MARKKIVVETKYTAKGSDKVKQSYKDVGDQAEKTAKSTDKVNKSANAFGDSMPGKLGVIQTAFVSLKGGIMKAVAGFKTLRGAVMSTGIGALVVLFGALAQYFTDNEEGASKLKQITSALGVVFGNITDVVSDMGEKIFNAFSNPKEAIKGLWTAIKQNVVNRIQGLGKVFSSLGKVIKSTFKLDMEGIKNATKELGENSLQAMTGIEDLQGKLNDTFKIKNSKYNFLCFSIFFIF